MKKPNPKDHNWNKNKQKRRYNNQALKKAKALNLKRKGEKQERDRRRKQKLKLTVNQPAAQIVKVKTVIAPEFFGLSDSDHREKLLSFIKKIKNHLSKGYKVDISFAETRKLLPCGTLWATAKIENLIKHYPNKLTCNYPEDGIVEQLFQHIGLLQKLGLTSKKVDINHDSVRHWHYVEGTSTDNISHFSELFKTIALPEELKSGLFDSMSEAVTNTVQHAYDSNDPKEWRMFAQKNDGHLDVALCDLGIGIPKSLRQKPELKEWLTSPVQTSKRNRDESLLEVAIQSSRSKTRLPHRGKGLKDMLEHVKSGKVGGFRVFSGKGVFNYSASEKIETTKHFRTPIRGTLIEWQIPLETNHDT